jgi:hypothetical protein
MWILLLIILTIIVFFSYNAFKTRCPRCGYFGMNRKDKETIKEFYSSKKKDHPDYQFNTEMDELINRLSKESNGLIEPSTEKINYTNTPLICNKCNYHYNRELAIEWANIASKLGEEKTIKEFLKLRPEDA